MHTEDDVVQLNVSRDAVKLLNRMEKLEEELCTKDKEIAKLQEQVKYCNSSRDFERTIYENKLSTLQTNLTILDAIQKETAEKLKIKQQLSACSSAGKRLQMVTLNNIGTYFFSKPLQLNWFNALKFCRSHGLELLSIESASENQAIYNKLQQLGFAEEGSFWTSGTDQGQEGHWFWVSTGQEFVYKSWHPRQPDNWKGTQHCTHIWKYKGVINWDDGFCTVPLPFVCELPLICK